MWILCFLFGLLVVAAAVALCWGIGILVYRIADGQWPWNVGYDSAEAHVISFVAGLIVVIVLPLVCVAFTALGCAILGGK